MKDMVLTQEDTRRGYLLLVTPEYPLADAGRPGNLCLIGCPGAADTAKVVHGSVSGSFSEEPPEILLEARAADMLHRLLSDIGSGSQILPVSGYRSHEEQIQIWEDTWKEEGEEFTRTYVAKPGHSEHESGLAIDLGENREKIDFIRPEFPRDGICGTFRERAADYGFIERYPAGKEQITGIGEEPWHFRYVGIPHGTAMKREGLILEEYIAFLKESTSVKCPYLCFSAEEKSCTEIFYMDMRGKEKMKLRIPRQAQIGYSGTNEGGIVVCRRRRADG